MIKNLQTILGVNVDASNRAKTDMKRGAFVKVDDATKELVLATATADVQGFVVRDVKVTTEVGLGHAVSEFDESQDLVLSGELAGVRVPQKGERFATTEYGDATALPEAEAVAGKKLDVVNGKLVKAVASTTSNIVSLGFVTVAGRKMLGFKLV